MRARQRTVDLSRYDRLDIKSITMRETNANDTMDAAARSLPPDGQGISAQQFGLEMRNQAVISSIIGYDGKTLTGPCMEYMDWSNRTREFVGEIYDYLNGVSDEERTDFRKALAGGAVADSIPSAISSGG